VGRRSVVTPREMISIASSLGVDLSQLPTGSHVVALRKWRRSFWLLGNMMASMGMQSLVEMVRKPSPKNVSGCYNMSASDAVGDWLGLMPRQMGRLKIDCTKLDLVQTELLNV